MLPLNVVFSLPGSWEVEIDSAWFLPRVVCDIAKLMEYEYA